jgi:hypothetical protein
MNIVIVIAISWQFGDHVKFDRVEYTKSWKISNRLQKLKNIFLKEENIEWKENGKSECALAL